MIIEFWSPFSGISGCTANTIAFASSLALHEKKTSLLQLQYGGNLLEAAFIMEKPENYLQDLGIDSLLRTARGGSATKDDIKSSAISYLNGNLSVYLPTLSESIDTYQTNLEQSLKNTFDALNDAYEFTIVDIGSTPGTITSNAIQHADVLVISLPQNRKAIETFFKCFHVKAKSLFFIIGEYDPKSLITIKYLIKSFKELDKNQIASVHYDTNYKDALSNASAARFFATKPKASIDFFKGLDASYTVFMKYLSQEV